MSCLNKICAIPDVDHRNLISLTGSPGQNNNNSNPRHSNGNDQMLGPPLDPPPIFNKFMVSSIDFRVKTSLTARFPVNAGFRGSFNGQLLA